MGKGCKSALLTMVERKTWYTVIVQLTGKRADLLTQAAVKHRAGIALKVKTSPSIMALNLPTRQRLLKVWVLIFTSLTLMHHGRVVSTKIPTV